MSGFCGVVSFSQPLERGLLEAALVVLAPFGGNGSGLIQKPHVALGHHLRHDTPESLLEQQPFNHPTRDLYIVTDAWLDNRAEVCQALGIRDVNLPNSQLILAAYEQWGEGCPERLLGDFSFAIWDADKRTLFCARDHIGARPFYYYQTRDCFYFANDIEALLAFGAVPPKLDLRFTRGRLEDRKYFHTEHTPFDGVKKLPFAHKLHVSRQGLRLEAHWQPDKVAPLKLGSEAAYSERLVELLNDAVRVRSRALTQVGSHISGGLDSTTVTVLAARQHQGEKPFQTFSWTRPPRADDYQAFDEYRSLRAIAQAENLKLHYTALGLPAWLATFTRDETRHPQHTLLAERVTSYNAKRAGVNTLLSGWGGDEAITFNGRGYFADLFRTLRWHVLGREMYLRSRIHGAKTLWGSAKNSVLLNLPPALASSLPSAAKRRPGYQEVPPLPRELHPDFTALLTGVTSYERGSSDDVPGVRTMQLRLLNHGHITQRMESWYAHGERLGLSYRYPLTDKRLLEFALAVPGELFFRHGWKRYLFRRSVAGILPDDLQWRKSKLDQAWVRGNNHLSQQMVTEKGLQNLVEMQREQMQSQHFVTVATLLASLDELQFDTARAFFQDDIHRSLWLAFVGADTFV